MYSIVYQYAVMCCTVYPSHVSALSHFFIDGKFCRYSARSCTW